MVCRRRDTITRNKQSHLKARIHKQATRDKEQRGEREKQDWATTYMKLEIK